MYILYDFIIDNLAILFNRETTISELVVNS